MTNYNRDMKYGYFFHGTPDWAAMATAYSAIRKHRPSPPRPTTSPCLLAQLLLSLGYCYPVITVNS